MLKIQIIAAVVLISLSTAQNSTILASAHHSVPVREIIDPYRPSNFTMFVYPLSQTIRLGETASYQILLNSTGGFTGQVSFQTKNFPTELVPSFNPPKINLTVGTHVNSTFTANSVLAGEEAFYQFSILGTSGNLTRTANVFLTLIAASPPLTLASYAFLASILVFGVVVVWYGLRSRSRSQIEDSEENRPKPPPV